MKISDNNTNMVKNVCTREKNSKISHEKSAQDKIGKQIR